MVNYERGGRRAKSAMIFGRLKGRKEESGYETLALMKGEMMFCKSLLFRLTLGGVAEGRLRTSSVSPVYP